MTFRLSPNSPKLFLNNPKIGAFGDRALQPIAHPAERLGTVPYSLVARHSLLVARCFLYSQSVYILV